MVYDFIKLQLAVLYKLELLKGLYLVINWHVWIWWRWNSSKIIFINFFYFV